MKDGITKITLKGYKSIIEEQSIDIKPLTILAGANSSGKSSFIQPLLLMKQTLESSYDPPPLLIDGPHINFRYHEEFLSKTKFGQDKNFYVGITADKIKIQVYFKKEKNDIVIEKMDCENFTYPTFEFDYPFHNKFTLNQNMTSEEIKNFITRIEMIDMNGIIEKNNYFIARVKCFLKIIPFLASENKPETFSIEPYYDPSKNVEMNIKNIINLSGIRGNPSRNYPITGISYFTGNFENYVASIIHNWEINKNIEKLNSLKEDIETLGINKKIKTNKIDDTRIEIKVSRYNNSNNEDLVNISDVGLGVSQSLPILVALNVAKVNQMVYIEQPELHLHPKAQVNMAKILAKASKRGVKVVIETHSSLLLLAIQTLIAEKEIDSSLVKLHWFNQDDSGSTKVTSADLDKNGAFGDWPEDFADIELNTQSKYINAVESRMME